MIESLVAASIIVFCLVLATVNGICAVHLWKHRYMGPLAAPVLGVVLGIQAYALFVPLLHAINLL